MSIQWNCSCGCGKIKEQKIIEMDKYLRYNINKYTELLPPCSEECSKSYKYN